MIFIAHIDEYRSIPDKIAFLDNVFNRYDIDGIECFHPAIDDDNRKVYIDYCKKNNLLISAGSDFHGEHFSHRRNITTVATLNDIEWIEDLK